MRAVLASRTTQGKLAGAEAVSWRSSMAGGITETIRAAIAYGNSAASQTFQVPRFRFHVGHAINLKREMWNLKRPAVERPFLPIDARYKPDFRQVFPFLLNFRDSAIRYY